jgi:hypothetical protein
MGPRGSLALLAAVLLYGAPGDEPPPAGVKGTGGGGAVAASASSATPPAYDAKGALLRPRGYRRWVFVGASLGLSYSEGGGGDQFHHVYLRPESYDAFRRTGRFPDKTVLVLELHEAAQKVAPSPHGKFEGKRVALEVAVKDRERFPDGWAYFGFGDGSRRTATAFARTDCFNCHRQHAKSDNVFVQFYPVLRDPPVD